jgi:hypothetical protein
MTADALESKSILEFNGKDFDVKQNSVEQEHANFLSENKEAIHAAYMDINKELTGEKKEESAEKKVTKEDSKPAEKKEED